LLETFARNTVDAFEARRRQAALGGHLRRRCATQAYVVCRQQISLRGIAF
jgi:hypothetical protein